MSDENMKSVKFRKLAEARTNKGINAIRGLGKLSNPYHYSYSKQEVDSMFNALKVELEQSRRKFNEALKKTNPSTFAFGDQ